MTIIKWNFKQIKELVNGIVGHRIESNGSKYRLISVNEFGRTVECSNASKSTVKSIIEHNWNVEIQI